jgi:hypothetical protein
MEIKVMMTKFLKRNNWRISLSLLCGMSSGFIFVVNFPIFWTIGRIAKLGLVALSVIPFIIIVSLLLAVSYHFKKNSTRFENMIHIAIAIALLVLGSSLLSRYYAFVVPPQWIKGFGTEIELLTLIIGGIILFPIISFVLSNILQWSSTYLGKWLVTFANSLLYQGIFGGFVILILLSLGVLSFNTTGTHLNLALEDLMMTVYSWVKYQIGDHLYPVVIASEENWLIFADIESIPDFQNTWPFSDEELQVIEQKVLGLDAYLANKGIELYFIFPPNKNTIYPDYLPPEIPVIGEISRMDQITEIFKAHEEIIFVDLEKIFIEEKETNQLYYSTDSHWNNWGAFIAYRALAERIHEDFPEIQPHPFDHFALPPASVSPGDIADMVMLNISEEFTQSISRNWMNFSTSENGNLRRYFQPDSKGPRLIMFHDSFGFKLLEFFLDHFSYSSFVHGWLIDPLIIEAEQPDIVIVEMTERKLFYLLQIPDL